MKTSLVIAAATGAASCVAAFCVQAQPRATAAAELYERAARLAVSAAEAERELGPTLGRADIVAGLETIRAMGVAAGTSGETAPASSAAAIVPASAPVTSRR